MRQWLSTLLAAATLFAASLAGAAEFPSQPIRIVVPFWPGGGTDVVARSLAEKLAPIFGVPVLVDNKPGGNSVIASRQVAIAPPDGRTLLLTTDIHTINAAYGGSLPYDSLKVWSSTAQPQELSSVALLA